jgi:hypothetical protein
MKLKHIFLGLTIFVVTLSGCDEITQPLIPKQVNSSLPNTPPTYTDSNTATYQTYKVLLEDCMGDKCSNCPPACATGDTLVSTYSNPTLAPHIVLMEENMGTLSLPGSLAGFPTYAFSTDYQSVAGNNWCTQFFNPVGYPAGYINRIGYNASGGNVLYIYYPNWQDTIQGLLQGNPPASATIKICDSCWVPQRIIGVKFQVTFLQALPVGNYSLESVIVEDHIISWQLNNGIALGYDSTFDHRFVLRGSFDLIGSGTPIPSIAVGSTFTSYQTYDFNKGENGNAGGNTATNPTPWNMANCYVIAFVCNQATHQVYQADMVKIE